MVVDLEDLDEVTCTLLGHAVARAQLLELQMAKLLEAQRHDLSVPLEERWAEILGWIKMPAGQLRTQLHVPEAIAEDLQQIVHRRNRVAHAAWLEYETARDHSEEAQRRVGHWLIEQAAFFGYAYNALVAIVDALRADGALDDDALLKVWRKHLPESVPTSAGVDVIP